MHKKTALMLSAMIAMSCVNSAPPPDPRGLRCTSVFDCARGQVCDDDGQCADPPDEACIDEDEDGFGEGCSLGDDCDDRNFFRNPMLLETCNGEDDDCDLLIDEDGVCDGECVGECEPGARECVSDTSWRECRTLNGCNTWMPLVHCDDACVDGDCTGSCNDFDGDGYGENCPLGPDCDDRNPFSFPGNEEVCDGFDNDCDNVVDQGGVCDEPCPEECAEDERRCRGNGFEVCTQDNRGCLTWSATIGCQNESVCEAGFCVEPIECEDFDNDGAGRGCQLGPDCDDTDRNIKPGAPDVCDAVDNDCDGTVDNGLTQCAEQWCQTELHENVATARSLARGVSGSGYVCPGRDALWDLGELDAGADLFALAQWADHVPDGIELSLLRGTQLQEVHSATETGVAFRAEVISPGRYFLRVSSPTQTAEAYTLGWGLDSEACDLDSHEPNNSPSTPSTSLFPGRVISGGICPGDTDFFSMPALAQGTTISVEFVSGADSRILLEVWHNSQPITPDQSRPDNAVHVHSRLDMPGSYVLAVRGINPRATGAYRLAVSAGTPAACPEDNAEDNDRISVGTPINGNSIGGTICPGDLDFFLLGDRAEGSMVDLTIDFDGQSANLDAYLFRDGLSGLLQFALTDRSPERLPTRIPNSGTYYVLVMGRGVTDTASYTIRR